MPKNRRCKILESATAPEKHQIFMAFERPDFFLFALLKAHSRYDNYVHLILQVSLFTI